MQTVPEQQLVSSAPAQVPWSAVHVASVQRRTPVASGTQGAKLQHWSRNWQTPPGEVAVFVGMQHLGSLASQPVGQVAVPPPKQRQMAFASCLQTAFFPSQQFCDALVAPLPPQMFPGGLQAWPLEQVRSSLVLVSYCVGPGLVPTESQKTP